MWPLFVLKNPLPPERNGGGQGGEPRCRADGRQMTGVVTITQERKQAAVLTDAVVAALTLPNGGRVASAGGVRAMGVPVESNGTGEDDRKCPIHERLPPPIKDVPCWV